MTSTDAEPRRRAPTGLRARGRAFWRASLSSFEFTAAEFALLEEVCRTLDNLEVLADAIDRDGAMITGSTGQRVVHPALTEARGQRLALHRLIAALALPDEDGAAVPTSGSLRGRRAAAVRWSGKQTEAEIRREGS